MSRETDEIQQPIPSPASGSFGSTTVGNLGSVPDTPATPPQSDSASRSEHEELLPDGTVQGWPNLANSMAETPDFAAFPRFRDLNVKSLLYYAVELRLLREELRKQEFRDSIKGESYAERADHLVEDQESDQFKLITKIRGVLKEYNKALLLYSQISSLPGPDPYNMNSLRNWIRHDQGCNGNLLGEGKHTWGNLKEFKEDPPLSTQFWDVLRTLIWRKPPPQDDLDLVVTRPQVRIDGLTRWIVGKLVPFYVALSDSWKRSQRKQWDAEENGRLKVKQPEKWRESMEQETIQTWSESGAMRVTAGISVIVACLLPVGAIAVLANMHSIRDLLLCLGGFTVIFAVGLMFLTAETINRVEIFTATATFLAVLVVFMSNAQVNVYFGSPSSTPIVSVVPGR